MIVKSLFRLEIIKKVVGDVMKDLECRVKEIIANILSVTVDEIEDDTAIGDIAEWDSLHHIQIISAIEKEFDLRFTPDVMMDLEDVSDIVNATKARVGK